MAELRSVAELESGQDLGWFFSQWAQSNRFLAYDIASQESSQMGEQYATKVIVRRVGSMRMPVPVRALFVDGTQQVKISDPLLDQNTLQFTSTASLKEVQLDPQGNLAMVLPPPGPPPPPTTEEGLQRRIRRLGWPGSGEDALPLFQATKGVKLADAWSWFKLGMVLYDGRHLREALESFRQAAQIAGDDPSGVKFGALVWQGHMLDLLGDRTQALQCYREALARSADFSIRHDQYGITLDRKWVEERIAIPFQQP
jgi:tetratricopeptide (TPR) repeat protein